MIMKSLFNKRLFEKAGYVMKMIIAVPIAFFFHRSLISKRLWLIGIQYDRYENNCKEFYEYIISHNENAYWVINKKNEENFIKYVPKDRIIYRGTIRNYIYAWACMVGAYSASDFDIAPGYFRIFGKKSCLVNLSHGYDTIKMMDPFYYKRMPSDIIICASKQERDDKVKYFSATPEKTVITGFARCDAFEYKENDEIKNIMIMPTWRDWYISERIQLTDSDLYRAYKQLLELLSKKVGEDVQLYFLFHPVMADYFKQEEIYKADNITYVFEPSMVNKYLRQTDLFITDYSSISYDCLYMKKPVIFYWFDYNDYNNKRGLFRDKDSFENVCFDAEEVVDCYAKIVCSSRKYSDSDRNKYWNFFDKNNSKRIYETICNNFKVINWEK